MRPLSQCQDPQICGNERFFEIHSTWRIRANAPNGYILRLDDYQPQIQDVRMIPKIGW